MLKDRVFPRIQRNIDDSNNIADCFLIPALSEAKYYDRGVGYFSLSGLIDLFSGIIPLIKKGGKIRCITSAFISEEDLKTLHNAFEIKQKKAIDVIRKTIEDQLITEPQQQRILDILTNLIAADYIQIKIAVMKSCSNYHEKFGIICDEEENALYFSGSANETMNGSKYNRESISILSSWVSYEDLQTIMREKEYFESLWNNSDDNVYVFTIPEAVKAQLFSLYKQSDTWEKAYLDFVRAQQSEASQNLDRTKEFRQYQQNAVDVFLSNNGVAFFEMATGTGKTYTAISAIQSFIKQKNKKFLVVILVPLVDLQYQWETNLRREGLDPILIGGNGDPGEKNHLIIDYMSGENSVFCICVYNTFFLGFYKELEPIVGELIIVVDEAHNLGPSYIAKLSKSIKYRLGLSATPTRYNADETELLLHYFLNDGEKPFVYGLGDAIAAGFLSQYEYYPLFVSLNESEMKKYSSYSKSIAQLMSLKDRSIEEEKRLTSYRSNRSSIVKHAESKFILLESMIKSSKYDFSKAVVYCGGGSQLTGENEKNEKSIKRVLGLLNDNGMFASGYMNETSNRKDVLEQFIKNYYSTLVAIKCFDEGIDVPSLERLYIMASDSSVRQTIQRRGRVLRVCKETGKRIAYIYDMVVLPCPGDGMSSKTLVVNELNRVRAYSELANNSDTIYERVSELENKYGIREEDYRQCLLEQQNY